MRFTATSKSRTSKVYLYDFYENKIFRTFSECKTSIYCKKKYKGISSLKALKRLVLKCIIFLDKLFICFEVTNNIYSSYCRTYLICQPTYFSWSQGAIKKVFTLSTCTFIYAVIQMSGKEVRISFKPCGRHWGRPFDEMEILSSDLWSVTRVKCFTNRQVLNLCIPRQIRCASLSISEYPSSAFVHLKVPKMFTKKKQNTPTVNAIWDASHYSFK